MIEPEPVYKRTWFLVLIGIVVLGVIGLLVTRSKNDLATLPHHDDSVAAVTPTANAVPSTAATITPATDSIKLHDSLQKSMHDTKTPEPPVMPPRAIALVHNGMTMSEVEKALGGRSITVNDTTANGSHIIVKTYITASGENSLVMYENGKVANAGP